MWVAAGGGCRGTLTVWTESWRVAWGVARPYSSDENVLHISYEAGKLEDLAVNGVEVVEFGMTVSPQQAPDKIERVTVDFQSGVPVAVNGQRGSAHDIVKSLNEIGGRNGVGRIDMVENRFVGMKSRGVYETPGVTVLHHALRAVESITLDREVHHLRDEVSPRYAEMVYNGFWFSPEREALQSFMDSVQRRASGEARLRLYKGGVRVEGRRAPDTLYDEAVATFEADEVYNQADATGFIKLNALRLRSFGDRRISEGE